MYQPSYRDKPGAPDILEANREISEKHLSTKRRLTREYLDQAPAVKDASTKDRALGHPFTPSLGCCHHQILLLIAVPKCIQHGEQEDLETSVQPLGFDLIAIMDMVG